MCQLRATEVSGGGGGISNSGEMSRFQPFGRHGPREVQFGGVGGSVLEAMCSFGVVQFDFMPNAPGFCCMSLTSWRTMFRHLSMENCTACRRVLGQSCDRFSAHMSAEFQASAKLYQPNFSMVHITGGHTDTWQRVKVSAHRSFWLHIVRRARSGQVAFRWRPRRNSDHCPRLSFCVHGAINSHWEIHPDESTQVFELSVEVVSRLVTADEVFLFAVGQRIVWTTGTFRGRVKQHSGNCCWAMLPVSSVSKKRKIAWGYRSWFFIVVENMKDASNSPDAGPCLGRGEAASRGAPPCVADIDRSRPNGRAALRFVDGTHCLTWPQFCICRQNIKSLVCGSLTNKVVCVTKEGQCGGLGAVCKRGSASVLRCVVILFRWCTCVGRCVHGLQVRFARIFVKKHVICHMRRHADTHIVIQSERPLHPRTLVRFWEEQGVDSPPSGHHIFSLHSWCTALIFTCCQSVKSHNDTMHLHGSSREAHCLRFVKKHKHLIAQSRTLCRARWLHTHGHSFLTFFWISLPASRTTVRRSTATAERRLDGTTTILQVMSPTSLLKTRDYRHFTGDGQFTEHEDLRVRPLSFHQSIIAFTCDSAESIATLPESDVDDEQLRALLSSPLYLQERWASAEQSQVDHSEREGLMSSSFQSLNFMSTGQSISRSDKFRETCRIVFKPHFFKRKDFFLKTSIGFWE